MNSTHVSGLICWLCGVAFATDQPYCLTDETIATQTIGDGARAIGDFNGDGVADIAEAVMSVSSVLIRLGEPNGTYRQPILYKTPASQLDAVDIDDDGDCDLVASDPMGTNTFTVLLNVGSDTQTPNPPVHAGPGVALSVLADVTGDGLKDMVTVRVSGDEGYWLYVNLGDGTFAAPVLATADLKTEQYIVAVDFDGDGDEDVLRIGAGFQTTAQLLEADGTTLTPRPHEPNVSIPVDASSITADTDDINGDGVADLAITYKSGTQGYLDVFLSDGSGSLQPSFSINEPFGIPLLVRVADVNLDSRPDVWAFYAGAERVLLLLNLPSGFTQRAFEVGFEFDGPAVGDLDGDGDLDAIARREALPNPPKLWAFRSAFAGCVADLNGDCSIDFADVAGFLIAFDGAQNAADLAPPVGVWDFSDVVAFLSAFGNGCP